MNDAQRSVALEDDAQILLVFEQWAKAVRSEDRAAIRANHDVDMIMFDVPPPFQSLGLDAYMATWETFYEYAERPVAFDFSGIQVTCGGDVAFVTAIGHCVTTDGKGQREPLDFRLTMGLRKLSGEWRITHEHHSLPAH
jgi:uncharacterized protein (TIGR02246 family)